MPSEEDVIRRLDDIMYKSGVQENVKNKIKEQNLEAKWKLLNMYENNY